jgi:hypothetical protein
MGAGGKPVKSLKVDEALKLEKLDEDARELILYDPFDDEEVLDDLDDLLDEE